MPTFLRPKGKATKIAERLLGKNKNKKKKKKDKETDSY